MFRTNKQKILDLNLALKITFTFLGLIIVNLVGSNLLNKSNINIGVLVALGLFYLISKFIHLFRLRFVRKVCNKEYKKTCVAYDMKSSTEYIYDSRISIILNVWKNQFYVKVKKKGSSESRSFDAYIKFHDVDNNKFSIIYNYENEPYSKTEDFSTHVGTGEISFSDGKFVSYYYFNNPLQRPTYGRLQLINIEGENK
ncbi:MAG: Cap15 family cyclic dinucleotide receptor domain-containing protein [Candidatus Izemoplasmataceae bacterium]